MLPNNGSVEDAHATVLHEVVGHKGLRGLLGDKFVPTMETVFDSLPGEIRDSLTAEFGDKTVSAEEYCSHMAENMTDPGIIDRICSAFRDALRRIGIDLKMTDGDIMYALWKSKNRLMGNDKALDMMDKIVRDGKVSDITGEYDALFRDGDPIDKLGLPPDKKARLAVDIQSKGELLQEAYVDRMIAVKKLQERIEARTGKPIPDHKNVYVYQNTLDSKNGYERYEFEEKLDKPMVAAIGGLRKDGVSERELENYVIAKHGMERNERMRLDELTERIGAVGDDALRNDLLAMIEGKTFPEIGPLPDEAIEEARTKLSGKDYSGITAIQEELGNTPIGTFIKRMETSHKARINELWRRIKAVNDYSLRKWYDSGMIDRETYDKIKGMYKNYVPLRGFDDAVAHDVYEYYTESDIPYNDPIRAATGRTSRPDSPFPYMLSMASSSIVGGNKNLMKLYLYRLAEDGDADGLSVSRQWYVYGGVDERGTGVWNPSYPEYSDDPETYRKNIETHEAGMLRLESGGKAESRKGRLNIGLRASQKERDEHMVKVRLNGEERIVYVHGNPKVAQAVNGTNDIERSRNRMLRCVTWLNRQMAANFTTRNPAFVLTNLSRDLIWSYTTLGVKEGAAYRNRFMGNIPKASRALIGRVRAGGGWKADPGDPISVMLDEFLKNGARTGYTALYSVEKYKKLIEDSISTGKWSKTKRGYNAILDFMQLPNEWAEDMSRFATYMTSRQEGRSVLRSVSDAKEVTVNFNRRGSGHNGAIAFRGLYLFFNAAVQSLNSAYGLGLRNPRGMATALGGYALGGMAVPLILSMMGLDDDERTYNGIPDYVRKNNLCVPLGLIGIDAFLRIPLPIELRAFYGMGDALYRTLKGEDEVSEALVSSGMGLMDLLPLNPMGGSSNYVPDAFKPVVESYVLNEDFTGKPIARVTPFNEYAPEYERVYKSASVIPVKISEYLNMITGGDEARRGWLDDIAGKSPTKVNLSNPAALEHLFESYLGGTFTFLNRSFKTVVGVPTGMNEFSWRNVPVLNRFVDTGEVDGTMLKVNEKYYKYLDDMREAKNVVRNYNKLIDNSPSLKSAEYMGKLDEFENSEEWRRAGIIEDYHDRVTDLEELLHEASDKGYIRSLREEIGAIKTEMVGKLKGGKVPEPAGIY